MVRREFFKQDPKVRENLDREIRILKLLRGCEYVVQLYHVQVSEIKGLLDEGYFRSSLKSREMSSAKNF